MASSDMIKEAIVDYFGRTIATKTSDWKRRLKIKLPSGVMLREFENTKLMRSVYTIGEGEDAMIVEKDVWIYGYTSDPDEESKFLISFEPRDRWLRERCLYDQHQSQIVEQLFGLFGFDEIMENTFCEPEGMDEQTVRSTIEACGFVYDQDLSDALDGLPYDMVRQVSQRGLSDPPVPKIIAVLMARNK